MAWSSFFRRSWARGKVVVVTGAGSGIGRAAAHAFGQLGARVHLADIHRGRVEEATGELRLREVEAWAHELDVRDPEAVERLAQAVYAEHGRCDVLLNNAGIGHSGLVHEISLEDWHWVLDTNLWGVIHGIHAFVPRMIDQGGGAHIVNTASVAGMVGVPSMAPYCASKFAVMGLSESLGAELSAYGIGVTAVCPGVIATDIVRSGRIEGSLGDRKRRVVDYYARRGLSPDRVARDIVRAVKAGAPVATTFGPVFPAVLLRRLSPRLYRGAAGMLLSRVLGSS